MAMRINQNIMAFNAYRNLSVTNGMLGKSLEKLSSGFRINRAADDAAGLVISQGLRAQVSGLRVASRNAQDGISVVQTAEAALNEVHTMLNRMRDLAVQAVNGSNDTAARTAANNEVTQLRSEIDRIGSSTKFGNMKLLNGSFSASFQVGANSGDTIAVSIGSLSVVVSTTGSVSTASAAAEFITSVDAAISAVSDLRAQLGAFQNRFESTINNLNVAVENLAASESRIRDTDMALEMVTFTRHQILIQAGTAMLGQANSIPQSVLRLLQ
ncbi:MAG: flagellin [Acidimicrobiia bacterium]|nr:flagellin [Acidimicrobiia bacterium]